MGDDPVVQLKVDGERYQRLALLKALAAAQAEMTSPGKDKWNPHLKANYATLASIIDSLRPVFAKHGLLHYSAPSLEVIKVGSDEAFICHVIVYVTHVEGGEISASMSCAMRDGGPQTYGACITYLRKYGLCCLAGVAPDEDDDAQDAQNKARQPASKAVKAADATAMIAAAQPDIEAIRAAKTEAELAAIGARFKKDKTYPEGHPAHPMLVLEFEQKDAELREKAAAEKK